MRIKYCAHSEPYIWYKALISTEWYGWARRMDAPRDSPRGWFGSHAGWIVVGWVPRSGGRRVSHQTFLDLRLCLWIIFDLLLVRIPFGCSSSSSYILNYLNHRWYSFNWEYIYIHNIKKKFFEIKNITKNITYDFEFNVIRVRVRVRSHSSCRLRR